ncbi:hypothetical protein QFC21_007339 [Naganishia friedmannii]|uniref:Uncharacterized protein n=1 Tax=Naganishia friedmannii TaxID=89922 RepID=A0ACC2UVM3_9TREE|nr:hypothetical protein QFC21_007339 [Naganishia friedmannii]
MYTTSPCLTRDVLGVGGPHEDGPAYYLAVAIISLSSPQCIDLYQYLSTTDPSRPLTATAPSLMPDPDPTSDDPTSAPAPDGHGKPIAAIPLARIYLEPRSLLILSSTLYYSHLHGISTTPTAIPTPSFVSPAPIAHLGMVAPEIQHGWIRRARTCLNVGRGSA